MVYKNFFDTLINLLLSFLSTMEQALMWLNTPFNEIFKVQMIESPPNNIFGIMRWFIDNLGYKILDTAIRIPIHLLELVGIDLGSMSILTVIFSTTMFYTLLGWGIIRAFIN